MEQGTKTSPAVEVWHPVVGYEGLYEVSNHGNVRSLDHIAREEFIRNSKLCVRDRMYKGRNLVLMETIHGYLHVFLCKDKKKRHEKVHILVANAFIPNPNNLKEINHKDECKINNNVENLEWCDHKYNMNYGTLRKRMSRKISKPFEQLTLNGEHIAFHESMPKCCYPMRHIWEALNGKKKSAYGYRWRYVDK